jgi:hypothetical protein
MKTKFYLNIIERNLKFKELEDLGYEEYDVKIDYINTYYFYKNTKGDKITVTLLCS